jgi:hypothetical protein
MKKSLSMDESRELLSLKRKDITSKLLKSYFAAKIGQKEPKFNTYDTFTLRKGTLYNNQDVDTTIGRYIFNMYAIPEEYLKKYGYQNIVFDADTISNLESQLSDMLMEDEISVKEFANYLDRGEWLTMSSAYYLSPTMTYDINVPLPEVIKLRDELFEKYKQEIEAGDPNVADLMEHQLLSLAKKILKEKNIEAYDFFESGEFSFANNYKKTSVFGGALENPYTKKLKILKSNYIDGISKDEFQHFANLTIIGGYSRNVETQKGGYETKKINNAVQGVMLAERGSDCGTTKYLKITISGVMKNMYTNRYILDQGKLLLLTKQNIGQFVGKEVQMRSPMLCISEHICNICAGEAYYKLGVDNAGLFTTTMSGNLMNMSMKKFHNTSLEFKKIDVNNFIKEH